MFYMEKLRSIVWKFFDLVEQEKDGKRFKMQCEGFVYTRC